MIDCQADTWTPRTYYILENNTSGKKYFGQTTQDINTYLGSGQYWKIHCKKYGGYNRDNISVVSSELFQSKKFAQKFIDNFTKENADYWEDHNTIWANLCEENTNDSPFASSKLAQKCALKRVADGTHNFLGGGLQRQRVKNGTHPFLGGEISRKNANRRVADGTHNFLTIHTCPHCGKVGKSAVMYRHHFDKCKSKVITEGLQDD
jgi:hypothetical protein